MSRIRANQITNQSADGAPTVQNGLVVSGVTTSTIFSGSGANLTSLPAQATIANNADNRVITGGSGVNLNGEAGLTFDGAKLTVTSSSKDLLYLNSTHSNGPQIPFQTGGTTFSYIGSATSLFSTGSSTDLGIRAESSKHILFGIGGNEKLRIDTVGSIGQGTGTPRTPDGSNADNPLNGDGTNGAPVFTIYGDSPAINLVSSTTASGDYSLINFGRTGSSSNPYRAVIGYKQSDDILRINAQNEIAFDTDGNINTGERLRIKSNGCIGINTTSPESNSNAVSLHIHGSANDDCRIAFSTPTKSNPGSRIGYFGLNRFGIDTYDGIEMRDVTRSYATIFKIDQNGYMTTNQPYGHLRFNAENDTGSFVTQSNVHTADVQNGMSHNGSGRLTVPVAGKYMLMLGCNLLDGSAMQFRMMKNGADIPGVYFQNSMSDTGWKSGSRSIILPLSANDYIQSKIIGKQDSQVWNHLTVYLLG